MGTNYYLFPKGFGLCECCGGELPRLHIGKQSGGWVFTLHGIDDDKLSLADWADWREHIVVTMQTNPKAVIVSDYDASISLETLEQLVLSPGQGAMTIQYGGDRSYDVLFRDFS